MRLIVRLKPFDRNTNKVIVRQQKLHGYSRGPCLVELVAVARRSNFIDG